MINLFQRYRQKLDEQKTLKAKLNIAIENYQKSPTRRNSRLLIQAILNLDENIEYVREMDR